MDQNRTNRLASLGERLDTEYASILNDSGRSEAQQVELREAFAGGYDDQIDEWARRAQTVTSLRPEVREAVLKRRRAAGLADDLSPPDAASAQPVAA